MIVAETGTYTAPELDGVSISQDVHASNAYPKTCYVHENRGTDPKDRTTWAGKVDVTSPTCDTGRSEVFEECLHFVQNTAAGVYPTIWGDSFASTSGKLIKALNNRIIIRDPINHILFYPFIFLESNLKRVQIIILCSKRKLWTWICPTKKIVLQSFH